MSYMKLGEGEYTFGFAKIIFKEGLLSVSDLYSSNKFYLDVSADVVVEPILPINIPKKLTNHIYIRFNTPIFVSKPSVFWVKAPYELLVKIGDIELATLSPFRVKYILYGDVVEGYICRYFESELFTSKPDLGWDAAYIKLIFKSMERPLDFLVIPTEKVAVHEVNGDVQYDPMALSVGDDEVIVKPVINRHKLFSIENIGRIWDELVPGWRYGI